MIRYQIVGDKAHKIYYRHVGKETFFYNAGSSTDAF